jgi:hypothetical protein
MSFSLRSLSILTLLGGLAAVLAGQFAPASLALLTDTASVPATRSPLPLAYRDTTS